MDHKFCLIAVNTPFNNSLLTYKLKDTLSLKRGDLVLVPLGKRLEKGCVLQTQIALNTDINEKKIKEVDSFYREDLALTSGELELSEWIAKYYHYPLGQLIFDCLPKPLKRPRVLKFSKGLGMKQEFLPNNIQKNIIEDIRKKLFDGFSKWLIHGVTGSGKTFIYLNMIEEVLRKGKSVLFLLPEINLTPQFLETLTSFLDAPIYSYNSSISNSDKWGLWKLLQDDTGPKVILGVRSSIFLPIKNLGIIIVDEEHDASFKQEDRCPYNARDIAMKKASLEKIPVLLGSATPTLETYYNFKESKQGFSFYRHMSERVGDAVLPEIKLIDIRSSNLSAEDKKLWPFTLETLEAIKEALAKKEQILVFVNRLGFANFIQCRSCGHEFNCPNCSSNLRLFKRRSEVSCSICDYKDRMPEVCPECNNMSLYQKGFGTERLEESLNEFLPEAKVARFDRDDIKTTTQLEERLKSFHNGEFDILVGTQMLSKGHNFKKVNLVIIMGIDSQLNFPDFRAHERVYQLLTQVSGRSGRFGSESKVLVQTLGTNSRVFSHVVNHSFDGFYEDELPIRDITTTPPFQKLICLYFTSRFQDKLVAESIRASSFLEDLTKKHFNAVEIIGPKPSMIEKKVNKYTWLTLLKSSNINELHNALISFKGNFKFHHSVTMKVDVDPYHIL